MKTAKTSNFKLLKSNDTEFNYILREVDTDLNSLFTLSKGRIRFGDITDGNKENISGEFITFTASNVVNTEFPIIHTLGVIPNYGYLQVKCSSGAVLYDGTTANTINLIYFRSTVANATHTAFILK